jgi:hypothetical protein
MEGVFVITYREESSITKKFGAGYFRTDGQWKTVATGQRSSTHAKDKAAEVVRGIEWELSVPEAPFIDEGRGWVDESPAADRPYTQPSRNL